MYSLRLLGGISLEGPSGPLSGRVTQRRRLALLALLGAARDKGVSRDKLVGYLWPETDSEGARHLLADSIYVLRGALGEEAIQSSGDTVRLNPSAVHNDLDVFESALERGDLEAAVRGYSGPFLDGFFISDAREFENWVEGERQRFAAEYGGALESLAEGAEGAEDYAGAAEWWRHLAAHDPFNSRVVLRRMKALAAAGDPANAIQCAREHEVLLREELGIEALEVTALAALLQQEPLSGAPLPVQGGPPVGLEAEPEMAAPARIERERRLPVILRSWSGRLVLGSAAVVVLALAWLLLRGGGAGSAEPKSIAVLPFENLTPDPANDYIAAGFHEEIIGQLAKVGTLRVIGRTSVLEYEGNPKDLRLIADELGVDHVLEGSVRSEGDRLRISAQLIDARHDRHLWAESYDRQRTDILGIQEDVALNIARALEAKLTPGERGSIAARPTQSGEAYDLYLRGNEHFRDGELGAAERMYARAIELDPDFALAFAMLSHTHSLAYYVGSDGTPQRLEKARVAVDRALELQPELPEGHRALGRYHYLGLGEFERALEHYTIALEHQPNDAETHRYLGLTLRRLGRWEEALEHLELSADLSPKHPPVHRNLATTHWALGNYSEAERHLDRLIDLEPTEMVHYVGKAHLYLEWLGDLERARKPLLDWQEIGHDADFVPGGLVFRCLHEYYRDVLQRHTLATFRDPFEYYYLTGQSYDLIGDTARSHAYYDSARVIGEERLERLVYSPRTKSRFQTELGLVYAGLGWRADAVRAGKAAVELVEDPVEGPNRRAMLAEIYVKLGWLDAAIEELQCACSVNANCGGVVLRLDPVWDPLRDDPRFQALLKGPELKRRGRE